MGIYGALATATTGLRAQAFALENISGNIANSQTTGYKRIETSFVDLIPEAPVSRQIPGAVIAQSRATNNDGGDVVSATTDTFMALNGSGFFVVDEKVGQTDGNALFSGGNSFTRRGDFDLDAQGYLVNGSGFFLKGLAVDATTGNVAGSVPEVIQVSNAFLPAKATTRIDYRLNLPEVPQTNYSQQAGANLANSELMDPASFVTTPADTVATATGTGAGLLAGDNAAVSMVAGQTLTIDVDGTAVEFEFYDSAAGAYAGTAVGIDVQTTLPLGTPVPVTVANALSAIQAGLRANGGTSAASATVALSGTEVQVTLGSNLTKGFSVTSGTPGLGLADGNFNFIDNSIGVNVPQITGSDGDLFFDNSISGGALTTYASNGAPVNVQMRWAKVDSAARGGTDTWNLFYMTDSDATGSETMWQNVGVDYQFQADGTMSPAVTSTVVSNLTVNGTSLGSITLQHNNGGISQYADERGSITEGTISQNGYSAGEFKSVAINSSGRVVASYSNNQQVELAQVVIARFNAPNSLSRSDGGLFSATSESGEALFDSQGGIVASSLEASNTDISEEFTKLIVTQQAYSAGTRIVSTADEMLSEALNMVR